MSFQPGALTAAQERMGTLFTPNQILGRTQPIGCTAVEITQRCNLDCTLCYLSEHSESVRDIPIDEIFNRLDEIRRLYGQRVHVQITGGDPTLRKHTELIEIVRYASSLGLYPALFTNGIAASRKLLKALAAAGLKDIAFHVDMTQRREGFTSEIELCELRDDYIARTQGLGLTVLFNTTLGDHNIDELAGLVQYFLKRAECVSFASFQMQAATGRGEWGARQETLTAPAVRAQIDRAVGRSLPWDVIRIGHPDCHAYVPLIVAGGETVPVIEDRKLFAEFIADFAAVKADRHSSPWALLWRYLRATLRRPRWIWRALRHAGHLLYELRGGLQRSRPQRLSLFVHDFMDASALDPERTAACSFMVMTADGPLSMCEHNAKRDNHILKPITFIDRRGEQQTFVPFDARRAEKKLAGAANKVA
ncbi:MAG: radical SAM protein [Pseudomonadota bacterium]